MATTFRILHSFRQLRSAFFRLLRGLSLTPMVLTGVTAVAFDQIRLVEPDTQTGTSSAVVVHDATLIHTAQFLPSSEYRVPVPATAVVQFSNVMDQLQAAVGEGGASTVVKLNLYVTSDDVAAEILQALPLRFAADDQPAVSLVVTRLPLTGAVVAVDAVACRKDRGTAAVTHSSGFSALPSGTRIYVSGQAEQSESLAEATQKTLVSLHNTLAFLGRSDEDIVQLKAFMLPMTDAKKVREQVEKFFDGKPTPPLVLVEWKSGRTTPIEIELIAWGGEPRGDEPPMEFLTPPGMTASPIYCRVCRVNDLRTIYVSGLYSSDRSPVIPGAAADPEVQNVFASLDRILKLSGSDFRHLAKATYYVSTDAASASLNKLRPDYYDSMRPPAASKAVVDFVGVARLGLTLDMIAVPNSPATRK